MTAKNPLLGLNPGVCLSQPQKNPWPTRFRHWTGFEAPNTQAWQTGLALKLEPVCPTFLATTPLHGIQDGYRNQGGHNRVVKQFGRAALGDNVDRLP
jgi:hypothetical protein